MYNKYIYYRSIDKYKILLVFPSSNNVWLPVDWMTFFRLKQKSKQNHHYINNKIKSTFINKLKTVIH